MERRHKPDQVLPGHVVRELVARRITNDPGRQFQTLEQSEALIQRAQTLQQIMRRWIAGLRIYNVDPMG